MRDQADSCTAGTIGELSSGHFLIDSGRERVIEFLKTTDPNIEHLAPVFWKLGINSGESLCALQCMRASERNAWLADMEEIGDLSRLDSRLIRLALQDYC